MVVVLPAPFGPRNPKISPLATRKSRSRTAWVPPNVLVSPVVSIAGPGCVAGGASCIQLSIVVVLRHRFRGKAAATTCWDEGSEVQPSGVGTFRSRACQAPPRLPEDPIIAERV